MSYIPQGIVPQDSKQKRFQCLKNILLKCLKCFLKCLIFERNAWRFPQNYKMFSESTNDRYVQFWHNLYSSLQFVLLKIGIDIIDSLETCGLRQPNNFGHLQQFFHHNFRLKEKFWIMMISTERSRSFRMYPISNYKIISLHIKINFFMIFFSLNTAKIQ